MWTGVLFDALMSDKAMFLSVVPEGEGGGGLAEDLARGGGEVNVSKEVDGNLYMHASEERLVNIC